MQSRTVVHLSAGNPRLSSRAAFDRVSSTVGVETAVMGTAVGLDAQATSHARTANPMIHTSAA